MTTGCIVMLDTTVPGAITATSSRPNSHRSTRHSPGTPMRHALVCLHHQPVPHGSRWLDELMLDNADELFAVLARHPRVRGLLWGHIAPAVRRACTAPAADGHAFDLHAVHAGLR